MNEIFNLENYKNYLIEVYTYEIDNNEYSKNKRKEYLENHYSDEFLESIINDTLNFSIYLLESNLGNETRWCDIDLLEDASYIFLNLTGGWFSDTLYRINYDGKEITISKHLLKKFLGNNFWIEEDSQINAVIDEDDEYTIYNEYYYPFIRISGNFKNLEDKYRSIKELKQKESVLVLKRIIEKCN